MTYTIVNNVEETIQDLIDAGWVFTLDYKPCYVEVIFNEPIESEDMEPFGIICV